MTKKVAISDPNDAASKPGLRVNVRGLRDAETTVRRVLIAVFSAILFAFKSYELGLACVISAF